MKIICENADEACDLFDFIQYLKDFSVCYTNITKENDMCVVKRRGQYLLPESFEGDPYSIPDEEMLKYIKENDIPHNEAWTVPITGSGRYLLDYEDFDILKKLVNLKDNPDLIECKGEKLE